ncbi:hypothetical protein M0813_13492 [Anaeramoeba flamelloides]|uniref:Uncharacterized protein n=1 Tax=Anaeramoeba flamelloides TaxID=1746091 RepID=A0ABQ8Z8K4_9EUKA|nr:hypothetical protein M0813_13492 [Anaeramoeba flamelloides]
MSAGFRCDNQSVISSCVTWLLLPAWLIADVYSVAQVQTFPSFENGLCLISIIHRRIKGIENQKAVGAVFKGLNSKYAKNIQALSSANELQKPRAKRNKQNG